MGGELLDDTPCPACGKVHSLYLDSGAGPFDPSEIYCYICDETSEEVEIDHPKVFKAVAEKHPGWIDCWPKKP